MNSVDFNISIHHAQYFLLSHWSLHEKEDKEITISLIALIRESFLGSRGNSGSIWRKREEAINGFGVRNIEWTEKSTKFIEAMKMRSKKKFIWMN